MESHFWGRNALVSSSSILFLLLVLPLGTANATGSIGRSVASFCAPAATVPDVGSCQACHSTTNESRNDLNAAGSQALSNPGYFCPAAPIPTPAPTPAPSPAPSPTPAPGTGGTGGGSGMSGTTSGSGMGFSRFRSRFGSGSGSRSRSDDDDDDHDGDSRGSRSRGSSGSRERDDD